MAVCIKDQIQNMNLVIGCTIGCSYCYTRNNVRRFHQSQQVYPAGFLMTIFNRRRSKTKNRLTDYYNAQISFTYQIPK